MTADRARAIVEAIAARQPRDLVEEVQQQNQQLLRALDDLQRKQDELSRLNRELEDTNRGVLAPYADLASRAGGFWPGNDFNATETAHERSASRQWRMTRRCRR